MTATKNIPTKNPSKARDSRLTATEAVLLARKRAKRVVRDTSKTAGLYGFTDFIREHGVVGVAIGLIFAAQLKVVVDQFLVSFVNPILGLILPGAGDLTQKKVTLTLNSLDKTAIFNWGQFAYVLLSFVLVAIIIFYAFKSLKLQKLKKD